MDEEIIYGLQKDLGLIIPETISKESILKQLKLKISEMLQGNAEVFFQTLYRLDISEKKANEAWSDPNLGIDKLALLIYERQMEKAKSRMDNCHDRNGVDEDLKW